MIAPGPLPPDPKCYFYGRYSHLDSDPSHGGVSERMQEEEYLRFYRYKIEPLGIPLAGPMFLDEVVSAFRKPFATRKAAKELMKVLKRGDHVVTRMDRAFRNHFDAEATLRQLHAIGVTVHLVDAPIDVSTMEGGLLFTILAWFAQWESQRKSERNTLACAQMRKMGVKRGNQVAGWKSATELDEDQRAIFQAIVRLRDDDGWTFNRISGFFETQYSLKINPRVVVDYYWRERAVQQLEQIGLPFNCYDAIDLARKLQPQRAARVVHTVKKRRRPPKWKEPEPPKPQWKKDDKFLKPGFRSYDKKPS